MWAVKGRAVGTHSGWRQERAGAPNQEPGCRTVDSALESGLGKILGRLSLRFSRKRLKEWQPLLPWSSCCC